MDEFQIINKYLKKLTNGNPAALNLRDDVFHDKNSKLVLSIDTYNEGIHYLNLSNPELLIKKIVRSSISDLICKSIKPKFIFISVSGNKNIFNKSTLNKMVKSMKQEQKLFGFKLSGGDTTFSKISSFTVTSVGFAQNIIYRNKAKNKDDIYVTGYLGDSFIGLKILQKKIKTNIKNKKYFIEKYYLPDLPIKFLNYLPIYANTSMDVSDGIFSDLIKLIGNQKLGFTLNIKQIPISPQLSSYIKTKKNYNLENLVSNGDDYQILFTASKKYRKQIERVSKRINQPITRIGVINNKDKLFEIINEKNIKKMAKSLGYTHKFK